MKMTIALVLMTSVLVGCKTTAPEIAYNMGFSDQFIQATFGSPGYQVPERIGARHLNQMPKYNQWQVARMELAKAGQDQVLDRYRYLDIGEVEHVMGYIQKNGQDYYVVTAFLAEYDKPTGRVEVCSMNYDRWNSTHFRAKVADKLAEMFPQATQYSMK